MIEYLWHVLIHRLHFKLHECSKMYENLHNRSRHKFAITTKNSTENKQILLKLLVDAYKYFFSRILLITCFLEVYYHIKLLTLVL